MLATIQDTSLEPTTYYGSSRVLGIGIGTTNAQGVVSRKDGLNVYNNGLVLAPSVTNSLIDGQVKALVTNEWVNNANSKVVDFAMEVNAKEKEKIAECINYLNFFKQGCEKPLATPLEYINGTYVKKSIVGGSIIYEPTIHVNAKSIIKRGTDLSTFYFEEEGLLVKVYFKEYPQISVLMKSGGIDYLSAYMYTGLTLCFEEVLTGVVTEMSNLDNLSPNAPVSLLFIGDTMYGMKEKSTKIQVKNEEGLIIHSFDDTQNNIDDTYFKINLSNKNLVKGFTYGVSIMDLSGNTSAEAYVIY